LPARDRLRAGMQRREPLMTSVRRAYPIALTAIVLASLWAWALAPPEAVAQPDRAGAAWLRRGEPPASGSTLPGSEPAYFRVGFEGEPHVAFTILLTDAARIQQARDIIAGVETDEVRVMGTVVKSAAFYNPPWSYHLAPGSIQFFAFAVEVCDAHPQYVEEHLDEACGEFLPGCTWCPFSSVVVAEVYMQRLFLPMLWRNE